MQMLLFQILKEIKNIMGGLNPIFFTKQNELQWGKIFLQFHEK